MLYNVQGVRKSDGVRCYDGVGRSGARMMTLGEKKSGKVSGKKWWVRWKRSATRSHFLGVRFRFRSGGNREDRYLKLSGCRWCQKREVQFWVVHKSAWMYSFVFDHRRSKPINACTYGTGVLHWKGLLSDVFSFFHWFSLSEFYLLFWAAE